MRAYTSSGGSGDWVETLSALVEDYDGNWRIVYYKDVFPFGAIRDDMPAFKVQDVAP